MKLIFHLSLQSSLALSKSLNARTIHAGMLFLSVMEIWIVLKAMMRKTAMVNTALETLFPKSRQIESTSKKKISRAE